MSLSHWKKMIELAERKRKQLLLKDISIGEDGLYIDDFLRNGKMCQFLPLGLPLLPQIRVPPSCKHHLYKIISKVGCFMGLLWKLLPLSQISCHFGFFSKYISFIMYLDTHTHVEVDNKKNV
jgi:hypothetical protein